MAHCVTMTQHAVPVNRPTPSLRARRAQRTRAEVYEAAIPLFHKHGFDDTTMAQVADAAGVSRRTLYRHFATKDDILFERPRRWLAVLDAVLDQRRPDEPLRDLVRRGLIAVAEAVADDATMVLAGYAILASTPSLAGRHGRSDQQWVNRYLELLAPEVQAAGGHTHDVLVTAMALVAAQNAVIITWANDHPNTDAVTLMQQTLDQLDPIWPAATQTAPTSPPTGL